MVQLVSPLSEISLLSAEEALARDAVALVASAHTVGRHDVERAFAAAAYRGLVLIRCERHTHSR